MSPRAAWIGYVASGVVVDLWRTHKCDGSTLCQATRDSFHTSSPVGRAAFLIAWAAFCAWFPGHILHQPVNRKAQP
jgi:hypothetical protein